MKNQLYRACLLSVALISTTWSAQAATITLAENVHVNGEINGNNPFSSPNRFGAENFSLAGTFDVTGISFVAHHHAGNPQPSSIDWRIYSDSLGEPGGILASVTGASYSTSIEGTSAGGYYDLTRYSMAISPLTLGAGNYWVGFHLNGVSGDPHWTFASSGTSFDGLSAISNDNGSTWSTPYPGGNMTFRVVGEAASAAVPETSSTLAILGAALLGFVALRRRLAA